MLFRSQRDGQLGATSRTHENEQMSSAKKAGGIVAALWRTFQRVFSSAERDHAPPRCVTHRSNPRRAGCLPKWWTFAVGSRGQSHTAYGCVREVQLDNDVLRVTLDPESLDDLGLTDPVIEALLRAPEEESARMREVLPRILRYGRPEARPRLIGA